MAWNKVGAVLKGKKGHYIKVSTKGPDGKGPDTLTLTHGQTLQMFDPRKSKFMTEERLAKIPEYVRFEIFVAPEGEADKE